MTDGREEVKWWLLANVNTFARSQELHKSSF